MAIVQPAPQAGAGLRVRFPVRVLRWLRAWRERPRRLPTVLAPALPALVLLALTVAATADPPAAGRLQVTNPSVPVHVTVVAQ